MSASKQRGTAAETAVVRYLQSNGFPYAERRALAGINDKGDVSGMPGCVLEVKNCKRTELAGWVDELDQEMKNAGAYIGAVVHKRRGTTDPGRWFATLPFSVLVDLLREGEA